MIELDSTRLVVVATVVFLTISSGVVGNPWDDSITSDSFLISGSNTASSFNAFLIDGDIAEDEWSSPVHKIQWYMDADPENSDGYNYMYIDEDPYNLYIALDLCSDQTNNESGEWVGVWLNTNETDVFNNEWDYPVEWEAALDKGMESLLHDVENDRTIDFFTDIGLSPWTSVKPSEWIVVSGTLDGTQSDILWDDDIFLNMVSEFNGTHYLYRLDLDIDFYDSFPFFEDMYVEHVQEVRFWIRSKHNTTIDDHFVSVSNNQGALNPDIEEAVGTGVSEALWNVDIFRENFTSGTNLRISMNGVNDAPFNTSFDFMQYDIYINQPTVIGQNSVYPYASIRNYDIAWSYGPSENNASDHRQFEIKIPKSELEGYEMETNLGVIVGGYGTLASWPGTHRWVFANSKLTGIPEEDSAQYNYYSMPMKGWSPPGLPVLDDISPDPDPDGDIFVNWNDDVAAENWTVYRHSSEITESNLDSATAIASGLTESQYNDTGLSDGTYWYAVVAIDSFGFSYLSNSESVTVELAAPPIDPVMVLLIGGSGAVVLLVVYVVVIRKRQAT